jgi:hypothetical protein
MQRVSEQSLKLEELHVIPNSVVRDSAASRNSLVAMALSFSLSTGTSVKDLLIESRKVPPGGYAFVDTMVGFCGLCQEVRISRQHQVPLATRLALLRNINYHNLRT